MGFDLSSGALGAGRTFSQPQPLPFVVKKQDGTELSNIVSISTGYNFTAALAGDGTVWAWGSNARGQLGQDALTSSAVPYAVQVKAPRGQAGLLTNIVMVTAGGQHAIALDASRKAWAWGSNQSGELGDGPNQEGGEFSTLPRAVVNETASGQLGGIISVAATNKTSLALRADGVVLAWGDNFYKELGRGNMNSPGSPRIPAPVRNLADDGPLKLSSLEGYSNLTRRAR